MTSNAKLVRAMLAAVPLASAVVPAYSQFSYDPKQYSIVTGILECKDAQRTECLVRNMPLIQQTDPRLDPDLKDMAGVGCYDTSIVTVIATALANRSPASPPLTGRTRQFDAVEPGKDKSGNVIPKIVKQLELEYHFARTHQQQRVVQKTNIVQPLYFHEVVADLAGKRIRQNCDPYTYGNCSQVTAANGTADARRVFLNKSNPIANQTIIDAMKQDYVTMIAYSRYKASVTYDRATKVLTVGLTNINAAHKVVFSGFTSGALPLVINDVGNARRYRVTLSNDLAQMRFADPAVHGTVPISKVVFPPELQGRTHIIYDNQYDLINPMIMIVDHYDTLRIDPGKAPDQAASTRPAG